MDYVKEEKENHDQNDENTYSYSSNQFVNKPITGAWIPFCLAKKEMQDCWSFIQASTFKIFGENYFKDKKKTFALNCVHFVHWHRCFCISKENRWWNNWCNQRSY